MNIFWKKKSTFWGVFFLNPHIVFFTNETKSTNKFQRIETMILKIRLGFLIIVLHNTVIEEWNTFCYVTWVKSVRSQIQRENNDFFKGWLLYSFPFDICLPIFHAWLGLCGPRIRKIKQIISWSQGDGQQLNRKRICGRFYHF